MEHSPVQQRLMIFINNFFKIRLGSCTIIWQIKIAVNYMELNTSLHIVTASLGLAIKLSGLGQFVVPLCNIKSQPPNPPGFFSKYGMSLGPPSLLKQDYFSSHSQMNLFLCGMTYDFISNANHHRPALFMLPTFLRTVQYIGMYP